MNLTVCELPHDPDQRADAWQGLVEHCTANESDVVVLPEMPFSVWLAATKEIDPTRWADAVAEHEEWMERFSELGATTVLGAQPIVAEGRRYNETFVWEAGDHRPSHRKYYLPDEDEFWEATWYDRGAGSFAVMQTASGVVGFLVCTEVWFTEHARAFAREGIVLLATPRATEWSSRDKWLAGGRAAAVMSGAFSMSSNHSGTDAVGIRWGGLGWIIDPDGEVLATTSEEQPYATVPIDPSEAERAKATYPRYVDE